ncbi:MAG: S8 family serine peptidase, partial [Clostridium sp.]|nr:S8 family serine peptidase [Clostridium sp.]
MARSSSWETTSDLLIKPEISAPGDGITSAVGLGSDTDYETWSGTSMAAPHISASIALVKQRLREIFPDATAQELNDLAYSF